MDHIAIFKFRFQFEPVKLRNRDSHFATLIELIELRELRELFVLIELRELFDSVSCYDRVVAEGR